MLLSLAVDHLVQNASRALRIRHRNWQGFSHSCHAPFDAKESLLWTLIKWIPELTGGLRAAALMIRSKNVAVGLTILSTA